MSRPQNQRSKTSQDFKQQTDVQIQEDTTNGPVGRVKTVPNTNPHSARNQSAFRCDSALNDGLRKTNNAVSHGLLMQYQAPVLLVKRPKCLNGPFDIYDVPDLRVLRNTFRKDYKRQVQNKSVNLKFFNDLELDDYFSKKSNWVNSSKFQNTSSFYSAVNVYLPLVKNKSLNKLTDEYTEIQRKSRMGSAALKSSLSSASQSRLAASSRLYN